MADKSNDPVAIWQNHDRRDGEGIQRLRQPGDGVAGIQQGRQSGRRRLRGRAKAARRPDGEISRQHEPAEPGADGRHGRAAAVDRRAAERDQGAAASGPRQFRRAGRAVLRPRQGRRAPGVRRPRAESKNERRRGPRSGVDPGADSVRGAARDPAQHQGRRIYRLVGPVARIDAEGHPGRPRHDESLSLPADRGRNLPRADPDRDGDHQPRLHPRHGAGPELHRVSAEARLRRLHAGLDRAEAGREELADGGLRPRLHSGLRPPRAAAIPARPTSP